MTVAQGELRGAIVDGVRCFVGVPYAEPPVGALRFRRARPAKPWEGVRAAVEYAPASYQIDLSNRERVSALVGVLDPGVEGVPPFPPAFIGDTVLDESSEDCLYLNIFAPSGLSDDPLPVYVYYHGGANVTNNASGRHDYQRGEALARAEGLIVVQPQYRVGALGWVHFGLIDPNLSEAINLGLHDQIAALRWISENIAAFGGDPDNITIGGESAGGTAVSHLISDPRTRRYARRAILQSLSPFNTWCTQTEPEARAVAETYQRVLGRGSIADIDPDELLAVQNVMLRLFPADALVAWRPHGAVVDGDVAMELPVLGLVEKPFGAAPFEVMIGFAKDEWQFFRGHAPSYQNTDREKAVRILTPVLGDEGAQIVFDGFATLYPEREPAHLLSDIVSFVYFKFSSLTIAAALAAHGTEVYLFQFSYDHPGLNGYLRALHTGTIPFIFRSTKPGQMRAFRSLQGADMTEIEQVSADFGELYGRFIREGCPGGAWRRYDAQDESVLWFGVPVESREGLLRGERELFAAVGIASVRELDGRMARLRTDLQVSLERIRSIR